MSLVPTARRADEFARLLETGARSDDPVVAPLTALATALQAVPRVPAPRQEFRAALRQRLVAVATVQEPAAVPSPVARLRRAGTSWRAQRRVALLASGAAAVTAIAGIGVSASRSLPGDPFYGIKRAAEQVQLAAAETKEAKGKRHLEFARTRLAEMQALVAQSAALGPMSPRVPDAGGGVVHASTSTLMSTLQDMDSETRAGAIDLLSVFRSTGSQEPLRVLNRFTQQQYAGLRTLYPDLPGPVQDRARSSLALLQAVATTTVTEATGAAPGTGPAPGATTPGGSGTGRTGGTPTTSPGAGTTAPGTSTSPQPGTTSSQPGGTILPTAPPTSSGAPLPTTVPTIPTSPLPTPTLTTSPLPTDILPLPSLSSLPLLPSTSTSSLLPGLG